MSSGGCWIERSTGLCFAMASSSFTILTRRAIIAARRSQASGSTRPLWSRVTWPRFLTWSGEGWPLPSTRRLSRTLLQGRLARGHDPPLRSMNQRQGFKSAAKGSRGGEAEPVFEYGCVDPAKVDGLPRIAVGKVGQAGHLAVNSALHPLPRQQDQAGGAMVGSRRAVLGDPAAELAEAENQHAIGQFRRGQVVEEGLEGGGEDSQQPVVRLELPGVRVIARLHCVKDPGAQDRLEQLRDRPQPFSERIVRIAFTRARRRSGDQLGDALGRRVGVEQAAADEGGKALVGLGRASKTGLGEGGDKAFGQPKLLNTRQGCCGRTAAAEGDRRGAIADEKRRGPRGRTLSGPGPRIEGAADPARARVRLGTRPGRLPDRNAREVGPVGVGIGDARHQRELPCRVRRPAYCPSNSSVRLTNAEAAAMASGGESLRRWASSNLRTCSASSWPVLT